MPDARAPAVRAGGCTKSGMSTLLWLGTHSCLCGCANTGGHSRCLKPHAPRQEPADVPWSPPAEAAARTTDPRAAPAAAAAAQPALLPVPAFWAGALTALAEVRRRARCAKP